MELSKPLRMKTTAGPESQLDERIEGRMPKIQNYVGRLVRLHLNS